MPRRSLRVRSEKRRVLRLPGGRSGVHYKRGKVKSSRCVKCGRILSGVPSLVSWRVRGLSASQRTVERPYGGLLCPACLQELLKQSVRSS